MVVKTKTLVNSTWHWGWVYLICRHGAHIYFMFSVAYTYLPHANSDNELLYLDKMHPLEKRVILL